jgi:Flp pilus assembly protein TadG
MERKKRDSGQTLVEFALIVPLLLLLVFGIVEFGRLFFAHHIITGAAREGCRAAAVHKTNDVIEQKVEGAVSGLVSDPSKVVLKTPAEYGAGDPGEGQIHCTVNPYDHKDRDGEGTVTVEVKGAVRIIVPIISSFFSENPKIIESTAEMRLE